MPALYPYPAYKPSDVEWFGDVPEHWEMLPLKRLGSFKSGAGFPLEHQGQESGEIPFFKVSDMNLPGNDKFMNSWNNAVSHSTATELGAPIFPPRSIVFPKVGGAMLTNKRRILTRPSCIDNNLMGCVVTRGNHSFVLLLLQNIDLALIAKPGPVPAISEAEVGEIRFTLPPPPEQAAIVRYLDHVDRRIRRYVSAKRKLIAVLEEERKIATLEAMQSPNTISQRLEVVAELVQRPIKRASDETYTPIGLYNRGRGMFQKEPKCGDDLGDSNFFWIKEGDLVISGQFAWEGAIALASDAEHGCVASHRYPILRGKPGILDSGFLLGFFQTDWGQLLLDHNSRGAAGRNRPLNARALLKEPISLPPIETQLPIAGMLRLESHVWQQARLSEQLLHEYRTRLIGDVVTGKLDVRDVAAQLPDEADDQNPIEESGPLTDGIAEGLYDPDKLAMESEVTV